MFITHANDNDTERCELFVNEQTLAHALVIESDRISTPPISGCSGLARAMTGNLQLGSNFQVLDIAQLCAGFSCNWCSSKHK